MNTLSRAITAQILGDPRHFHSLRQHWGALMRSPRKQALTAAHHLVYLCLIGKDWRRGFTPITNRRKLANGAFHGWMLFRAIKALHTSSLEEALLAPFDGLVTPAMLQHIRRLVPFQQSYRYQPDQFTTTAFPFDAYSPLTTAEAANTDEEGTHA